MTEGKWRPPSYHSTASSARWTTVLLAVSGLVGAASAVVAFLGHSIIARTVATQDLAELDSWGAQVVRLGYLQITLLIATALAFLVWEYRLVGNIPSLGGGTPRWSPAWSVIWWFVPVAFFVMPYVVMRDITLRLAWTRSKPTRLVLAWWMAWVLSLITGQVSNAVLSETGSLDTALNWLEVSSVTSVIAAALAIRVVRRIQANAEKRTDRVGAGVAIERKRA